MKAALLILALLTCGLSANALAQRQTARSPLANEPGAVYLEPVLAEPLKLTVAREAPVFSDVRGRHRVGFLRADQEVVIEAITDRAYRVRGSAAGSVNDVAGWVGPWAFTGENPTFVDDLKKLHARQIEVEEMISNGEIALGMTMEEVRRSRGEPTKSTLRRAVQGQSGSFEYIEYEDVRHYVTRVDRFSGAIYRQFSHLTREEKSKTVVEFENDLVTAIEETEQQRRAGGVRIIVQPIEIPWGLR